MGYPIVEYFIAEISIPLIVTYNFEIQKLKPTKCQKYLLNFVQNMSFF